MTPYDIVRTCATHLRELDLLAAQAPALIKYQKFVAQLPVVPVPDGAADATAYVQRTQACGVGARDVAVEEELRSLAPSRRPRDTARLVRARKVHAVASALGEMTRHYLMKPIVEPSLALEECIRSLHATLAKTLVEGGAYVKAAAPVLEALAMHSQNLRACRVDAPALRALLRSNADVLELIQALEHVMNSLELSRLLVVEGVMVAAPYHACPRDEHGRRVRGMRADLLGGRVVDVLATDSDPGVMLSPSQAKERIQAVPRVFGAKARANLVVDDLPIEDRQRRQERARKRRRRGSK